MINHDISKLHLHKEFEMEFYYGIVLSPDDKLMAAYRDHNIFFWDITLNWSPRYYQEEIDELDQVNKLDNENKEKEEDDKFDRIAAIQFSQDGSKIAVGLYSSKVKIRDAKTYGLLKIFTLDPLVPQKGDIKKIYFDGDILKVATNACYTQQFNMRSDDDPYRQMRRYLLYTKYYTDLIFEAQYSRVLVNETLIRKRDNGQITHKTLFKQKHKGITSTKQNQIYCLDSDKLYIIYQRGRIIRKAKQEQGIYRYAASKRFIACLKAKLLNLYDLCTGVIVSFKHDQLMSVIGLNSNFVVVGDWPMRIYNLLDDLRVLLPEEPQEKHKHEQPILEQ